MAFEQMEEVRSVEQCKRLVAREFIGVRPVLRSCDEYPFDRTFVQHSPIQIANRIHAHSVSITFGLPLPQPVDQSSLTTLREMLIEIGAKVARHGR